MEDQHHLERDVQLVAHGHRRLRTLLHSAVFLLFVGLLYISYSQALPLLNSQAAQAYRYTWHALWNCTGAPALCTLPVQTR